MRRISGLTDEQILAYEARIETATRLGLQRIMDALADRIAAIQVAAAVPAVLVAAEGTEPVEGQEPDVPAGDALPPGQPYVSPDDLATIPPAWQTVIADQLVPILAEVWIESTGMIYASMLDATGGAPIPRLGSLAAEQYLRGAVNTFEEVGDHLWGTARAQLLEGFERGESIPQLAQRLRDSAGISARTGTLVARSQVIEASNAGSIATARSSGLAMQKEWIATPDPRTRPTHIAADGQRVDLNEPFIVGGYSADFPASPSLPPAERYNCRCTIGYLMPEREARQAPQKLASEPTLPGQEAPPELPTEPEPALTPGPRGYPATSGIPARPGVPARPGRPGRPGYPARPGRPTPSRTYPSRPGPDSAGGPDVPDALEPADVTGIRPELRAAKTLRDLQVAWRAEWNRITGSDTLIMIPPDASLLTMRQYAEGLLQAAERFPSIRLREIGWISNPRGEYAHLVPGTGSGGTGTSSALRYNSFWASEAQRPALLRSMRGDVKGWTGPGKSGWSVRGASSPQATSYHEFAHALDMETLGGRVRTDALRLVERRAALEGIEPDTLVARDISAYAGSDTSEMIAEAFTDVMINGEAASAISREIYGLLVAEYRRAGLGLRLGPVDVDVDLDFDEFSQFPKIPGLASRTVPQLRALAAERGVTIPAGARKADIVRLLEEPGPDIDVPSVPAALTDRQIVTAARAEIARLEADRSIPDRLVLMEREQRRLDGAEVRIKAARRGPDQGMFRAQAAEPVADSLAALDELTLAQGSARAIEQRLRTMGLGMRPELVDELVAAGASGDRARVAALIARIEREQGIRRTTGPAGSVEPFDPAKHQMAGGGPQPPLGSPVYVFRPGYVTDGPEPRDLFRASVSSDVPAGARVAPTPDFEARVTAARDGDDALTAAPKGLDRATGALTEAQEAAVREYLSFFGYRRLNGGLRSGTLDASDDAVRALDEAMATSRLADDVVVYRGVRYGPDMFGDDFAGDLTGREFGDPAYVSTGTSVGQAENIARHGFAPDSAPRDPLVMRILGPRGTGAVQASDTELLLARGLRFRVVADHGVVGGMRRIDVEIVPAGPVAVAPVPATVTSTRTAIARQAAIDKARVVGDLGADVLEQLENGMGAAALRTRITQTARRLGSPDKIRDALLAAVDDPATLRQAVAAQLRGAKIDIVAGDAGTIVRFDRRTMQAIADSIADDAHVIIVRPGLSFLRGRERIQLSKATVETATPEEVALFERRATRAAARARNAELEQASGTARLLAEMDELLAKKADASVIRERLDDALLAPEALFANADPAVMKALRDALGSAGDVTKLRAVVTRLSTKAKIKAISRSGSKVKYDPDLMDPLPGAPDIKAGAQVTVVTRGSTVTLPDGTVVQLRKAVVTPVAKPVKATKPILPSRSADPARTIMDDAAAVRWHDLSGPEWSEKVDEFQARLAAVVDGDYAGGITVRVEEITPSGDYMSFSGLIVDTKTGRKIGEFDRVIRREPNGDLVARHSTLEIDRKHQGSGFAEEFNQNLYDWYRRSGIQRVELTANIDVGGYAWATKGFDFVDAQEAQEYVTTALKRVRSALRRKTPPRGVTAGGLAELQRYLQRIDDGEIPARAFDISQFGRRPGQVGKSAIWPGKWLMIGKNKHWDGVMYL